MKYYLLSQLLAVISTSSAFVVQNHSFRSSSLLQGLDSHNHGEMETFERAVNCAEKFGVCDVEKIEELAKELEETNWSYFETNSLDKSLKEGWDRMDLAEVLQMQIEYRLRMEYIKDANLFVQDVHDMQDAYPDFE